MRTGRMGAALAALVAAAAVAASASGVEARSLRLATTVWPPFTDVAGSPHVALDLVHEALKRAGYDAASSVQADGTLMEALEEGLFDGSAALWRSPERERFLLYSRPYLDNRIVLVGAAGSPVDVADLSELEGKRIGIVDWYAYGDAVAGVSGPVLVPGRDDPTNLQLLLDGELDYVLADELVVRHVFQRYPAEARARLQAGTDAVTRRTLHLAVRKDLDGAEDLIAAFDEQIPAMLADGSYNRILKLRWVRADVDGDGTVELVASSGEAGPTEPTQPYDVLAPEIAPQGKKKADRYVIGGEAFEAWDTVPSHHKQIPGGREPLGNDGVVLLRF